MKTAINGKIRLKWFWRGMYSGRSMTPIGRIFRWGNLTLAKVVYAPYKPFSKNYYKSDVLELLREYYDVRWEKMPGSEDMWHSIYSKIDGGYVGRPEDAYRLLQQGITDIQKAEAKHEVCSIGFNHNEQKWYGWSHRATSGFGVGDVVEEGSCCASSGWTAEYLKEHPEEDMSLPIGYKATNLNEAKRMAIAFAESVS